MSTKTVELLSPAGDPEKLRLAVLYGAHAVYLGSSGYTMRRSAGGFSGQALFEAVSYCHARGVRAYLTCNTLPRGEEADGLEPFLFAARDAGVDALIAADIGVILTALRLVPGIPLHVSTQAGVVNWRAAAELYALGARRVVLARELSLDEIRIIRAKTPPDLTLEVFVHGAMCMSFSGRCLISDYLAGRDANRGDCAQPCRWKYRLVEEKRPGEYYPLVEEEDGSYFFNARDLCMIEHLDALIDAGVGSLKIEGRAKSAYYAAAVTNAYRAALDARAQGCPVPAWAVEETMRVSHRPYSTGFYFGRPARGQEDVRGGTVRDWDIVAFVETWRDGRLLVSQRNKFCVGDRLEALQPGQAPRGLLVQGLENEAGDPIDAAAHAQMRVRLPCAFALPEGAVLRKQRSV